MNLKLKDLEIWFITGSQHLYGEEALRQVETDAKYIVAALNQASEIPVTVVYKPVMTGSAGIRAMAAEANAKDQCIGLIVWMHTFSPARMWISGLSILHKPYCHFHTQFNRDIPWTEIDMDFMNLNQSAHGGREFGFINARMRKQRKVVVGHWQDPDALRELGVWMRVAAARHDAQGAKIARFGDNMREVAVTEGDKVAAQMQFGYEVNGYGIGDLVQYVDSVTETELSRLIEEYEESYELTERVREGGSARDALKQAAKIELGLRKFLNDGGFKGFTTTFENLTGLEQLPGLAVQRLMRDGYGFGAEGDWKTAALLRAAKVMSAGLPGGTSFMEDYTYHLDPAGMRILGAHMLEVCESIAGEKPVLDVQPLSIGGKADPARLIFTAKPGPAVVASVIDLGNRFRMIVNKVKAVTPPENLPKLPVARVLWKPEPSLKLAATAWILAGGAHHTVYSQALTADYFADFCVINDIEYLVIDENTNLADFQKEMRINEVYYMVRGI